MKSYFDQASRTIQLPSPPKRIISLVPSQTELLYDLGLREEVVGITKFCVHPDEWFRKKTRVGGTKTINPGLIKELQPDLILANKEENVREQIEELHKDFPVWVSDVNNLTSALEMIDTIGELTGRIKNAEKLITDIRAKFKKFQSRRGSSAASIRTAYLIWRDPYMTVGGDTFISDIMKICGLQNVFEKEKRYPKITVDQMNSSHINLILLPSEPFPFKQTHLEELKNKLPASKILLVDGEMFSWYGSRLQYAPDYFIGIFKNL